MRGFMVLFLFFEFTYCSISLSEEITADFCRKACDNSHQYAGWCIPFGLSAKKTATPYITVLKAAQSGAASFKLDSCEQSAIVTNKKIVISGKACSVVQKGLTDLTLATDLPKTATATVTDSEGILEVTFQNGLFQFGFATSKYSSVGPVAFVTTHFDQNGESKVLWGNGEFCFTAFVNY